jgi:hypothetical protein
MLKNYDVNGSNVFDVAGASATALREGSWASSHAEPAIPLMTAGVVTPIGKKTANALQTVALVLVGMQLVAVTAASMSSLTPATMTLSTPGPALCAMLSSRTNLCGLCSSGTW